MTRISSEEYEMKISGVDEISQNNVGDLESGENIETQSDLLQDAQFKLHVVRAMVAIKHQGEFSEKIWQKLNKEFQCNCKKLRNKMKASIMKKLKHLVEVNDCANKSKISQLSATEWLLFDHMLVHENVDVVWINELEPQCMQDLFDLVKEHHVESLAGDKLAEAWIQVTFQYNKGGRGRECSPMLLQLRWHQLKKFSRDRIYKKPPHQYRHQKLLIAIAIKYQKIITVPFVEWKELIKKRLAILPAEFEMILKREAKWKEIEACELWYLKKENRVPISDTKTCTDIAPITITNALDNIIEPTEFHCGEKINGMFQQSSKAFKHNATPTLMEGSNSPGNHKDNEIMICDSDDEINEILRQKANNLIELSQNQIGYGSNKKISQRKNKVPIKKLPCKSITGAPRVDNELIVLDSDDEMDKILQEKANTMSIDEFINVKDLRTSKRKNHYDGQDDIDFDTEHFEFVDDGIELVEDVSKGQKKKSKSACSSDGIFANDQTNIDVKLLMNATVYTKKLNHMEVFKFMDYKQVTDKRVIKNVLLESKPVDKYAPRNEDIDKFREQAIPKYEKTSTSSGSDITQNINENIRTKVKCTSWLLQKPKKRRYTLTQLSQNPDFNTELKSVTAEFLNSARNMDLLKKCIPLTVDLHKEFEKKLINGRIHLKRDVFKTTKEKVMENKTRSVSTPLISVRRPSALLKEDFRSTATEETEKAGVCKFPTDMDKRLSFAGKLINTSNRRKVINLPHIDEVRLTNQSLLTAEITPTHQIYSAIRGVDGTSNVRSNEMNSEMKQNIQMNPTYLDIAQKVNNVAIINDEVANGHSSNISILPESVHSQATIYSNRGHSRQQLNEEHLTSDILMCNEIYQSNVIEKVSSAKQRKRVKTNYRTYSKYILPKLLQNRNSIISSEDSVRMFCESPNTSNKLDNLTQYLVLPDGVNFVNLASNELAVSINPGVKISEKDLRVLMSVCASANAVEQTKQNIEYSMNKKSLLKIPPALIPSLVSYKQQSKNPLNKIAGKKYTNKKTTYYKLKKEKVQGKHVMALDETKLYCTEQDEVQDTPKTDISNIISAMENNMDITSVNPLPPSLARDISINVEIENVKTESNTNVFESNTSQAESNTNVFDSVFGNSSNTNEMGLIVDIRSINPEKHASASNGKEDTESVKQDSHSEDCKGS